MSRYRTSRPRRARALILLTALTAAAAVVLPTTGALAGKSAPPPPVLITVTDVVSSVTTPLTGGQPTDFVAIDAAFDLAVSFTSGGQPAAISDTKDVTLQVTVAGSSFASGSPTTFTIAKGAKQGLLGGIVLAVPGNGVVLTVSAVAPRQVTAGVTPGSSPAVDVAKDFNDVTNFNGPAGVTVSRDGVGTSCKLADRETCVDLVLPADVGNGRRAFFSTGVCDASVACPSGRDLMQVLAEFNLPIDRPASLIVKCSKALCGGQGISKNIVKASLSPTGLLQDAPACGSKGVMTGPEGYCVDYVQSSRDGAGITYLYLLMIKDARMSIG